MTEKLITIAIYDGSKIEICGMMSDEAADRLAIAAAPRGVQDIKIGPVRPVEPADCVLMHHREIYAQARNYPHLFAPVPAMYVFINTECVHP